MGYLLTCMTNRAELLGDAIAGEKASLVAPPIDSADGYGVGFYQAGEVLHKKRPHPADRPGDWNDVVAGVRAHLAIAQVRQATDGDRRADNTHPFRMRQWLFAHAGKLAGFEAIRTRLAESLPDFLRRNIRGDTDSEYLFHLLLSFIHDAGQLDATDGSDAAVVGALRSTTTLVDRLASEVGAQPGCLNLALTNGRQIFVMRRGTPVVYVERERAPLAGDNGPPRSADTYRYVISASAHDERAPTDYHTLADSSVLVVDRDLRVNHHSL